MVVVVVFQYSTFHSLVKLISMQLFLLIHLLSVRIKNRNNLLMLDITEPDTHPAHIDLKKRKSVKGNMRGREHTVDQLVQDTCLPVQYTPQCKC